MEQLNDYHPRWPETVIFWGAGAPRALNMHTTADLGRALYNLADRRQPLAERVKSEFAGSPDRQAAITDLLLILGPAAGPEAEAVRRQALDRQFPALPLADRERRGRELKATYDWGTLQRLIGICPGHQAAAFKLQDLFNLLDMHITGHHGFHAGGAGGPEFIMPESLPAARDALVMIIGLLHFCDYQAALRDRAVFNCYTGFAEILARLMLTEGGRFYRQGHRLNQREFYLFSYAVVNMNWDPVLLWLLFNAHRTVNNEGRMLIGRPPAPLKLFHDLSYFLGLRPVGRGGPGLWQPVNEAVVQRINDPEYDGSRRFRIGKFYFPHGCSGWRECPSCGKLTMYLGDDWGYDSPGLLAPQLLPGLAGSPRKFWSATEAEAVKRGRSDVVLCVHCGTLTELRHTPLVFPSNFKGKYPPFLEEIQRDMRVALEQAGHIVFLGYTLPPDDVVYRSLLAARQKRSGGRGPYCSVVVGRDETAPDCWLTGRPLAEYLAGPARKNKNTSFIAAVRTVQEVFAADQVRAYARGIPEVFAGPPGKADYRKVINLLYPRGRIIR